MEARVRRERNGRNPVGLTFYWWRFPRQLAPRNLGLCAGIPLGSALHHTWRLLTISCHHETGTGL